MHVISRKALREFWERYPDAETALVRWFQLMERADFASFAELRTTFPSAELAGDYVVFNIAGNKYRLIAVIHFNRGRVYVRHALTYQAYDKGAWKR